MRSSQLRDDQRARVVSCRRVAVPTDGSCPRSLPETRQSPPDQILPSRTRRQIGRSTRQRRANCRSPSASPIPRRTTFSHCGPAGRRPLAHSVTPMPKPDDRVARSSSFRPARSRVGTIHQPCRPCSPCADRRVKPGHDGKVRSGRATGTSDAETGRGGTAAHAAGAGPAPAGREVSPARLTLF